MIDENEVKNEIKDGNDITNILVLDNEECPKRGRGRPRKEKKQKGATGNYFDSVEEYLMEYLNTEDEYEKNKIFNKHLYSPMYYMIQTILMRYFNKKFIIDEDPEDIISDTFSFLITKLHKYDPEKKFKAYSYIQAIIKHYIGSKYLSYDKRLKRHVTIGEVYQDVKTRISEEGLYHENNINTSNDEMDESVNEHPSFINDLFKETIKDINTAIIEYDKYNLNEKDCNVGRCLVQILGDWENIIGDIGSNKFNKNTLLFFISESTFLDIKTIRVSLKKYKIIYQNSKKNLLNIY